jgi:hypothetical protein
VAGLVMFYVSCVWISASLFDADRCPTCDTSLSWLQHLMQHLGLLAGSIAVLVLQYYRRQTFVSRVVLAVGVLLLVVVQLPWNEAFTIQTWMGVPIGSVPAAIRVAPQPVEASVATVRSRPDSAKRATQALLQGDVDEAVQNLRGIGRPRDTRAVLTIPLRIAGTTHDEFLVVDHADFAITDARGNVLYRGAGTERKSVPLIAQGSEPGVVRQKFELPGAVYERIKSRAASIVVDYSLTVRAVVSEHTLPATGGQLRSPEVGWCQSDADSSASYVRCRQIGRAPNCYAATLYGPDGRHNPEVRYCGSDYRPFIPSPINIVSFAAMEMPIRDAYGVAHYEVDGSDIADSYIIFKIYETGRHFRRTVVAPIQPQAVEDPSARSTASHASDTPLSAAIRTPTSRARFM